MPGTYVRICSVDSQGLKYMIPLISSSQISQFHSSTGRVLQCFSYIPRPDYLSLCFINHIQYRRNLVENTEAH